MIRIYLVICGVLFFWQNSFAQHPDKSWTATGAGNTYTNLQTATGARPQVPCGHSGFTDTGHIDEVIDPDLGKYAFRFYMHANVDGNYNQCDPAETKERQRNELAYNVSKPTMKVQYKWQMKLPDNFKTTSNFNYNFCHLHQIKLRDGAYSSQPMFTISAWNDQLILITSRTDWSGDTTLASEPLTNFKGKWVEITEVIVYDQDFSSGRYGIIIKEMHGAKNTLFEFIDNDIQTWKGSAANLQVKWGIYRSRTGFGGSPVFTDLQDEVVLYDNFDVKYLNDATPINFDSPKVALTINSINGTVATNPLSTDNQYDENTVVNLTAVPAAGYEFEKWEGAITGTINPTAITMNTAKTITAVFKEKQNLLSITTTNGTVTTTPQSSDNRYGQGTEVTLTAIPNQGFEFEKWEGDLNSTNNTATITMNAAKTVTAVFKEKQNLLSITATNGTVTTTPQSSDNRYGQGTEVTLTAIPNQGFEFDKWEGDLNSTNNPATITMNASKTVTAVFKEKRNLLTINASNGTVATNPSSSDNRYAQGTQISLNATPNTGFEFERWEGDIIGTENPFSITMDAAKTIAAIFKPVQNLLTIVATNGTVTADLESNTNEYDYNTQLTLTAVPNEGYEFDQWEGGAIGTDNPILISMDTAKTVTALFKALTIDLELTSEFSISANPVNEMLTLSMGDNQEIKTSIVYNSRGQKVLESQNTELDFSTLSSGIYLLKVACTNDEIIFKKILKR